MDVPRSDGRRAVHRTDGGATSSEWGVHHHPHRGTTAAREWAVVEHTIAHPQYTHQIPYRGWDWECRLFALHVCVAPTSTVAIVPITDEGREWLRAHESASEKRDRLLARFADLDPAAAAELEDVIAELVADARESASDEAYAHDEH